MKIGIVSMIRNPWGGSEELWAAMAEEAIKQGHAVVISAIDCGRIATRTNEIIKKGAVLDLRTGTIPANLPLGKRVILRLKRIFQKTAGNPFSHLFSHRPDVIVYTGTAYSIAKDFKLLRYFEQQAASLFINIQLNRDGNNPSLDSRDKKYISKAYRLARQIYFVSERNKEVAQQQIGHEINNGIIVRNPVNITSTELIPLPSPHATQFAMVGNLVSIHKGQDIVLSILQTNDWASRDWHLNIYGTGEDEQMLKNLITGSSIAGKVTFHGRVENIRQVWARNHILLMPSRMEGMPLAVVEAMICGRPSVVTDVGGHTEWIEEGKEGWIAAQADKTSFADAMEKAWEQKDNWEKVGVQAHHKALTLYDPQPGKTLLTHIINSLQR